MNQFIAQMNIALKTSRLMLFQSSLLSFDIRTGDRTLKAPICSSG